MRMRSGFIGSVILSTFLMAPNNVVAQPASGDGIASFGEVDSAFDPTPESEPANDDTDTPDLLLDESEGATTSPQYPSTGSPSLNELDSLNELNPQNEQGPDLSMVQELKTKIREEEDEDQRQKLADELTKVMQELFEEDFQKRDDEVKKLEDRVAKLRSSLDKRKAARDRIIKNRIEAILLEADGLGLPGERNSNWADAIGLDPNS